MNISAQQAAFKIVPLRADFLVQARTLGLDDQRQPVERHLAQGGEPCRDVLRRARPGEQLILASYCPFKVPGPYREYGPVFILAGESTEAPAPGQLPAMGGEGYFKSDFVLRAYCAKERIVDAAIVPAAGAEQQLNALFARTEVHFVLARFAAYGCYACRIERAVMS
jgi:hypothetical protein